MCLSYIFRVTTAATLLLATLATGTDTFSRSSQGTDWNVPASAAVVSEQKKSMPKNSTQAVELLRFVTAYKKNVEALVDITPYSALIKASADTDGDLTFFAFIDTWVGNNTDPAKPVMRLDNAGKCAPSTKQDEAWGDAGRSGNGFQLDADMVFWPRNGFVDTRPHESITISSGYYGSYNIGSITTHEGTVGAGGGAIELTGGADLTGTLDAEVYQCPSGAKDIERGVKMGKVANKVLESGSSTGGIESIVKEVFDQLIGDSTSVLSVVNSNDQKRHVEVTYDDTTRLRPGMPVWYEKDDLVVQNGSSYGEFPAGQPIGKVVAADGGRATIEITGSCLPGNSSSWLPRLKLERAPDALAKARSLADSFKTLKQRMDREVREEIVSLLARQKSTAKAEDDSVFRPFLVGSSWSPENTSIFSPLPILGQIDLGFLKQKGADCAPPMLSFIETDAQETKDDKEAKTATKEAKQRPGWIPPLAQFDGDDATAQRPVAKASASSPKPLRSKIALKEGDKVCVLARRSNGRVFERTFELPTFVPAAASAAPSSSASVAARGSGDRVLLQFAVTGHGWSGSTEQCGEFCHAIYHIKINGKNAANVTEWRDDCENNPVSGQFGTWEIHRDGWCPGSVEPGLYLDVTKLLNHGRNEISVDLSVWSSLTRQYQKYTNYGNYFGDGDGAVLFVGATLFVYDGAAVDAIKGQRKAYTAAEAALREGCSMPKALRPPEQVNSAFGSSFLQRTEKVAKRNLRSESEKFKEAAKSSLKSFSFLAQQSENARSRYNFEARAPWYQFSEASEGKPGSHAGAKKVPVFTDGLIQINTREIRVKVKARDLPQEWGQAAMHIRLERPTTVEGLELDNWDRVGSLGLVFEEGAATTKDPNSRVLLRPSTGRKLTTSWKLL